MKSSLNLNNLVAGRWARSAQARRAISAAAGGIVACLLLALLMVASAAADDEPSPQLPPPIPDASVSPPLPARQPAAGDRKATEKRDVPASSRQEKGAQKTAVPPRSFNQGVRVDDPLEELRERIERIERSNAELEATNRELRRALGGHVLSPEVQEGDILQVGDLEGPLGNEEMTGERLRVFEQQLQDQAATEESQNMLPGGPSRGPVMTGRWGTRFVNNGLWFESEDKAFRAHVGGRTQYDTAFFAAPHAVTNGPGGIGPLHDGTDFRRARIRVEGAMYEQMEWCVEYDFVNGVPLGNPVTNVPAPLDLWWNFSSLPVLGNIRVGNQKEPFGFERMMSSRFLNFVERSYNQDAFYSPFSNGFSPGIQAFNSMFDERMTWAAGLFRNITNVFVTNVGQGAYAGTGRLTFLPWYEDNGRELLHLGASGRVQGLNSSLVNYRVRGPERSGISPQWVIYAKSPTIFGGVQDDVNFELVSILGPVTIQSEYTLNFVTDASLGGPSVGTLFYQGGYVEVSYFLTGENREYVKAVGLFDRVAPKKNAYWLKTKDGEREYGWGAWQVGARYNYLNLNDKGINGGVLNDMTFALTWFLNSNSKIQGNYSLTQRSSPNGLSDGVIQGFDISFRHDF